MITPFSSRRKSFPGTVWLPVTIVAVVFLLFVFLWLYARRYVKAGPNEVLVISGRRRELREPDGTITTVGFRIIKGGGAFIWPIVEKYDILSLEIMTIDVKTPEVYTITGVPVLVDGVAQIKVKGDDVSISTAAEQFLSMTLVQIMNIATQTLEGHLRAIVGTLTVEEIYKNRDAFAQRVQEVAAADLANMGLTIISFTLRDIRDDQGYLDALGKPRTAQVKRDAIIAQAEADRDSTIKSAQANQAGQEAKFAADAKIAEANRDYQMKVADYTASVNLKKAEADLGLRLPEEQDQSVGQVARKSRSPVIEKQKQIEVQEKEILAPAKGAGSDGQPARRRRTLSRADAGRGGEIQAADRSHRRGRGQAATRHGRSRRQQGPRLGGGGYHPAPKEPRRRKRCRKKPTPGAATTKRRWCSCFWSTPRDRPRHRRAFDQDGKDRRHQQRRWRRRQQGDQGRRQRHGPASRKWSRPCPGCDLNDTLGKLQKLGAKGRRRRRPRRGGSCPRWRLLEAIVAANRTPPPPAGRRQGGHAGAVRQFPAPGGPDLHRPAAQPFLPPSRWDWATRISSGCATPGMSSPARPPARSAPWR